MEKETTITNKCRICGAPCQQGDPFIEIHFPTKVWSAHICTPCVFKFDMRVSFDKLSLERETEVQDIVSSQAY